MKLYITIDGDDIGDKISVAYLQNDEVALSEINSELHFLILKLCDHLASLKFEIIFCAADGIVCKAQQQELTLLAEYISTVGKPRFTFSAGVGYSLRSSYFALKYAKATGKNKVVFFEEASNFRVIE